MTTCHGHLSSPVPGVVGQGVTPSQALQAKASPLFPLCPPPPWLGDSPSTSPALEVMASGPRCVQGQVTRAQEAEENYVIKRELAVVRQQCSSATEDLQKAQSTIRQLQEQQVVGRGLPGPRPRPHAQAPSGPAKAPPTALLNGVGGASRSHAHTDSIF